MDKVKEFLELVKNDPKGKELAEKLGRPKNDTEAIDGYLRIAKELNFSLTEEELTEGLKNLMRERKTQSEKITLDAEDLDNVAGGYHDPKCSDTYETEGEWCWFTDSCTLFINNYYENSYYYEDPNNKGRDSYFDPQEGDGNNPCENLAEF